MTQHNLGSALHEQGTRTDGPDAVKLLGEAVAAYQQALLVRTREQQPRQWAITQNSLGNALQAQGTRAAKQDALRLLDQALVAYREALVVFTSDQSLALWAMTKHNLGSALQEQATRTDGPQSERLLREAVAAYNEALMVWTRERRPQQWAMAQNNLARAHFNLKEWLSAAGCYENVLEVYPDFRPAYEKARFLEHEVLLNFPRALKLNEQWLQRNPGDSLAAATLAENQLTTGSFEESERRISSALSDAKIEAQIKIPVRAIEIANLVALNRSTEVPSKLNDLIKVLEGQPVDFKVRWSFAGIKWSVSHKTFPAKRDWLVELFEAMEGENREAIVKKLRIASEKLKN
jgi:tetratricopeptide (TPR) repeat protein